jgi:SulP family sulfate permease
LLFIETGNIRLTFPTLESVRGHINEEILYMMSDGRVARRLRGDVFGGLTAGVVALPLALAFGVSSGAGPAAGLYGAIAVGLFASLFGGTKPQVSGPTGPMTVVFASAIAGFSGDFRLALATVLLAGALQVVFGLFRLGGVVRYIPYPVISGFMTGIGVIIILLQTGPLLGAKAASSPMAAILALPAAVSGAFSGSGLHAVLLSAITLAVVFFYPVRLTRIAPSPLTALILGTVLASVFHMDVATIGTVPAGLPTPSLPAVDIHQLGRLAGLGLALAILGSIDSLLTSLVADSLTRERHSPNRELIGQGIGNMAAALVGGLPGAGATMRTVVNIKAGGSSQLSGAIHALLLLGLVLGLGPLASGIPMCVLAGILVKVGVDILDYRLLRVVRNAPKSDLAVMVVVLAITVLVDLMAAVAAGVTMAALLLTLRIARQTRIQIEETPDGLDSREAEQALQRETDFGVRIISIRGPFFFGTASLMQDKIGALLGARVAVVDCLDVPFMDISAVFALSSMVERCRAAGIRTLVVSMEEQREKLVSLGLDRLTGPGALFTNLDEALAEARRSLVDAEAVGASASSGDPTPAV